MLPPLLLRRCLWPDFSSARSFSPFAVVHAVHFICAVTPDARYCWNFAKIVYWRWHPLNESYSYTIATYICACVVRCEWDFARIDAVNRNQQTKQTLKSYSFDGGTTVVNDSLPKSLLSTWMLLISFSSQFSDAIVYLSCSHCFHCDGIAITCGRFHSSHSSFVAKFSIRLFSFPFFCVCGGFDSAFAKGLSIRFTRGAFYYSICNNNNNNRRTEEITDKTMCTFMSSIAAIKTVCGLSQYPFCAGKILLKTATTTHDTTDKRRT